MLAAGKAHSYEKGHFRSVAWDKSPVDQDICTCETVDKLTMNHLYLVCFICPALSKVHKKPTYPAVLKSRKNLQSKESK